MTRLSPRPTPDAQEEELPPALPRLDPIEVLPILILEPHSRCNCRCLMCDIWKDPVGRQLPLDLVREWSESWRGLGVQRVVLTGGEPLLHPQLGPICDLLQHSGIRITLLSTGLLLERKAKELAGRVDEVIVSLDGPPEVHDRIRQVPRAFQLMASGLEAVRTAAPAVALSGRCTVQRQNFGDLRATVDAARSLGLQRISFLAADSTSEAFNRPGGWDSGRAEQVALQPDELPRLAEELDRLQSEYAAHFATGFIAESPDKLRRRLLQHFRALHGLAGFAPQTCNAPWVSAVLEPDGTVRPCFFHKPYGRLGPGDSLMQLVNGEAARAFRQRLDVNADPVCRRCVCTLTLRESPPCG